MFAHNQRVGFIPARWSSLKVFLFKIFLFSLYGVILASCGRREISVRCLNADDCRSFGPYISLHVEFSQEIAPDHVEAAWYIEPHAEGVWVWESNRRARWTSHTPFSAGQTVQVGFRSSEISDLSPSFSSDHVWQAVIRAPEIAYLAQTEQGMELFRIQAFGSDQAQMLTQASGEVVDFSTSRDGEQIAFSAWNTQGGADIWLWRRESGEAFKLLDCQPDICSAVTFSPMGTQLAFTRELAASEGGDIHLPARVWLVELTTGADHPLSENASIIGYDPTWSPDGQWISFWSGLGKGIEVVNRGGEDSFSISSSSGDTGCWSPDSRTIYFSDLVKTDENDHVEELYSAIYRAQPDNASISLVVGGLNEPNSNSYLLPVCHPQGKGFAVYVRPSMNIPGRALWWVSEQGEKIASITDDISVINSHAAWSPDGQIILFLVNEFSAENDGGNIMVWLNDPSQPAQMIVDGAFQPAWLP